MVQGLFIRIHILKCNPSATFVASGQDLCFQKACPETRSVERVDPRGVEPPTFSLQMKRSTGELRARSFSESIKLLFSEGYNAKGLKSPQGRPSAEKLRCSFVASHYE